MTSSAVFGPTGLVGSHILSNLLTYDLPSLATTVQTISRRAPQAPDSSTVKKLHAVVEPDTSQWTAHLSGLSPKPTVVFSALGTSRAAAGSIANQWKIDHDLNVELANAARKQGVRVFVFISSAGTGSAVFGRGQYLRMKEGVEQTIQKAGFEQAVVLRPGVILGEREASHPGEPLFVEAIRDLGKWIGKGVQDGLGQDADVIAKAAVKAAQMAVEGNAPDKFWVLHGRDILRLGRTDWDDSKAAE